MFAVELLLLFGALSLCIVCGERIEEGADCVVYSGLAIGTEASLSLLVDVVVGCSDAV